MSDPEPDLPPRPVTGNAGIDAALAAVDLTGDVHSHPEQVERVLAALHEALNPPVPPQEPPGATDPRR